MQYIEIMKKIDGIIKSSDESKKILEKIVNILYEHIEYYDWVGIYIVKDDNLYLGPWKGKQETEHIKIPIGKGICGSAAETGKTEIVDDVNSDERYLACFVSTKSEIVVPIKKQGKIVGEIDIDSDKKDAFTKEDALFLEKTAEMLSSFFS